MASPGPISVDDAVKLAQASQELLRKDYLTGIIVLMGAAILGLVAWVIWLQQQLRAEGGLRVQDHKEGEARATSLTERMALHMDRSTEATVLLLAKGQGRGGARTRSGDVAQLEPVSQAKKLPEGA